MNKKLLSKMLLGSITTILLSSVALFDCDAKAKPAQVRRQNKKNVVFKKADEEIRKKDDIGVKPTTSFDGMPIDVSVEAEQAYLMDHDTGAVLLEKNATQPMHPASMTKIMTAYIVSEKLKNGHIKPDQMFNVSKNGYKVEGSSMFLEIDKPVSVMDLLKGLVIQSGNDASVVLAENIAGSVEAFASEMTRTAQSFGLNNTNFKNASGLPHPEHLTTAKDLAIISQHVIRDHPEYYQMYKEKSFRYNNISQGNRNPLLYKNIHCDGIKTGHSTISGYGMVASCTEDNRRLILVINGLRNMQKRSDEAMKLMTWGFRSFTNKVLCPPNKVVTDIVVRHGVVDHVSGVVPKGINITVPRIFEKDVKVTMKIMDQIEAPIAINTVLGTVEVSIPSTKTLVTYDILAQNEVKKANFIVCIWRDFKEWIAPSKEKLSVKSDIPHAA